LSGKTVTVASGTVTAHATTATPANVSDTANTSTGYFDIPAGTTAQRPGSPAVGNIRVNTTTDSLEHYYDGGWIGFAGSTPTISSIGPTTSIVQNTAITVNGTNFQSGVVVKLIGTDNTQYSANSTTYVSSTELSFNTPNLPVSNEPYDVKVLNSNGGSATSVDALDAGGVPSWTTAAGSLGTITDTASGTHFTLAATEPDSQAITFAETTSVLSGAGLTLNSNGTITGAATDQTPGGGTTYSFDATATDVTGINATSRSFAITIAGVFHGATGGTITTYSSGGTDYKVHTFLASGTFNTGVLGGSADILAVAGGGQGGLAGEDQDTSQGGGGAGAVGVASTYTMSAGAWSLVVGNGGYDGVTYTTWPTTKVPGESGDDTTITDPSSSLAFTAKGGGGGARSDGSGGTPPDGNNGVQGGSGGGGGGRGSGGNSGGANNIGTTYTGFTLYGNSGGNGTTTNANGGGGGGGAGAAGSSNSGTTGGAGGVGLSNSFRTGSAVYYGGGGAGGSNNTNGTQAQGGNGGGGDGNSCYNGIPNPAAYANIDGDANTGGGGGGSSDPGRSQTGACKGEYAGGGGSGIIVIRYAVS
jgi:hypothetical protein